MSAYKYFVVNRPVVVEVCDGVVADAVSMSKEKKGDSRKGVSALPEIVHSSIPGLMMVAAGKAYRNLRSEFVGVRYMPNGVSVTRIKNMEFTFNFIATFCIDEAEDVAGYSMCSIVDEYDKSNGRGRARRRLVAARSVLSNGNPGKEYEVRGVITSAGINRIRVE
jgi:hypothetical protein